jgi:hypothetical protein
MKLFEIINLKTEKIYNSPKSEDEHSRRIKSNKRGAFSWVEDDETDPFLVNKKHFIDSENPESRDGFYVYLNKIKDKMAENPFFPRVYELRKHHQQDAESYSRINSKIEKLFPLKDLSIPLQDAMVKSLLDMPKLLEEVDKHKSGKMFYEYVKRYEKHYGQYYSENMIYFLIYLRIIDGLHISPSKVIKNKELEDALNLILSSKRSVDLHDDNVMFRRTPYGPQLVLSDPLSF